MGKIRSFRGLLRWLANDLEHFCRVSQARTPAERLRVVLEPRLWCLAVHRFGQWVYGPQPGRLRPPLKLVFHALDAAARLVGRCHIEVTADIGERCFLGPYGTLFIGGRIGDDVTFHGDVTVGWGGRGSRSGVPIVASRVSIGPGAVLVGPIHLSEGASVGANAVAVSDLPASGCYVGAPALREEGLYAARIAPIWSHAQEALMGPESFWVSFRRDLARHLAAGLGGRRPTLTLIRTVTTTPGVWACFVYRLQRSFTTRPSWRGRILLLATWPLELFVRLATGIVLDRRAQIGAGFFVGHFGSIYVGPSVRIGEGCNIGQGCFLGPTAAGAPRVGDRVYLGVGAKILGPIQVGDGAAIGANAVPLADVPSMAVAVGNPAHVVGWQGSTGLLEALFRSGAEPASASGAGM